MMHVCLHDSFSVNYACVFACSSDEEKPLEHTKKCDAITVRSDAKERTHILRLPPGRVVTFTNLKMNLVKLDQECGWGPRTDGCRASAS